MHLKSLQNCTYMLSNSFIMRVKLKKNFFYRAVVLIYKQKKGHLHCQKRKYWTWCIFVALRAKFV